MFIIDSIRNGFLLISVTTTARMQGHTNDRYSLMQCEFESTFHTTQLLFYTNTHPIAVTTATTSDNAHHQEHGAFVAVAADLSAPGRLSMGAYAGDVGPKNVGLSRPCPAVGVGFWKKLGAVGRDMVGTVGATGPRVSGVSKSITLSIRWTIPLRARISHSTIQDL